MAAEVKIFCDWCGREIGPHGWLHRLRIFPIKKRYWEYRGYRVDIGDDNLVDDMVCDDCKWAIVHFVEARKNRKDENE